MNIIIVNTQPVPSSGTGAASVNRILSYAKGLINRGNNVRILSTAIQEKGGCQEYEGVPVRHLGTPHKKKFAGYFCFVVTTIKLIKALSEEKKDVVLFVTSNYFLIIILELYCRITGIKIVNEKSEYPFVLMTKNDIKRLFAPIYTNTAYRLLDGMILMTKPLMDYYSKKCKKDCKFIEVPMTVDVQRFSTPPRGDNILPPANYVTYCGNMGGNKDGLRNLLNAFAIVEKRGFPLTLLLIGDANNKQEYDQLISLNESLGNKHVLFYGKADRDMMPTLLQGATMLVLARPSSLQSTGGFPTKLGEYLSTGNPVIVTAVGDIPQYLKNNENAYVVPPDDNEAFADAICWVWSHLPEAKEIGMKGQQLAMTVFNGEYQAERIEQYLKELTNYRS